MHISRKTIFDQVAETIGLSIKQELAIQVGQNNYLWKIEIDGILNKTTLLPESKEFYGDHAQTAAQAVDSANNKALEFLEEQKVINS